MQSLIYLLRHGEIDKSSPRRFLGQTDLPLNQNGINQAKRLGQVLADIPFSRFFSSSLSRAMQTATFVSGRSTSEIVTVDAFREIDLGTWEGLTVAEVRQRFPNAYEERGLHMGTFRPLRGESFAEVAARALPVLQKIANKHRGPTLIVAHAGVNRAILSCLQDLPFDDLLQIPQDYCGVNILQHKGEKLQVQAINKIFH
ncbi:MAG: histidine phosphatase family protein [Desulfobulbus sp.]|nr:histidine phosphatase family protein [Desulfobulbus sp.]